VGGGSYCPQDGVGSEDVAARCQFQCGRGEEGMLLLKLLIFMSVRDNFLLQNSI
jgi:hypothetical protein